MKEPDEVARIKNGWAECIFLPITIKNVSDQKLVVGTDDIRYYIVGNTETKDTATKQQPWFLLKMSAPIVAPGESISSETVGYDSIEIKHLQDIGYRPGDRIVAVVDGRIADTNQVFECCSAPFTLPLMPKGRSPQAQAIEDNIEKVMNSAASSIPLANGNITWDDLGVRDYLSVTPNVAKISFSGGDFVTESAKDQQKEPDYPDRIKNGWARIIFLPFTIKNTMDKKLIADTSNIRFYIVGNERTKARAMAQQAWLLLRLSIPVVAPGESIASSTSGRDDVEIGFWESIGYKPGDQIVAVVDGRIADTNQVFESCSAPFTLPPMPKGEPPEGAGK